jgi:hypothetical protein
VLGRCLGTTQITLTVRETCCFVERRFYSVLRTGLIEAAAWNDGRTWTGHVEAMQLLIGRELGVTTSVLTETMGLSGHRGHSLNVSFHWVNLRSIGSIAVIPGVCQD